MVLHLSLISVTGWEKRDCLLSSRSFFVNCSDWWWPPIMYKRKEVQVFFCIVMLHQALWLFIIVICSQYLHSFQWFLRFTKFCSRFPTSSTSSFVTSLRYGCRCSGEHTDHGGCRQDCQVVVCIWSKTHPPVQRTFQRSQVCLFFLAEIVDNHMHQNLCIFEMNLIIPFIHCPRFFIHNPYGWSRRVIDSC